MQISPTSKCDLISESFSRWLQSSKKYGKDYPEHLFFMWIVLRIVIWLPFFGDLSQSETLSEIKPPLANPGGPD